MGVCSVMVLGASPGQMSLIPADAAAGDEVIVHTLGAIDVGMLMQLVFLTCREHLSWILLLSLVYRADTHVGGLAGSRSA